MVRDYDSPLRERQAAETHERIVEAMVELVVEEPANAPTMAAIAERAGVALRTVYRHFPTRADLLTAMHERIRKGLGVTGPNPPGDVAELRATLRKSYVAALADEPFQRAKLLHPYAVDAARQEASARLEWLRSAVRDELEGCDEADERRLVALLRLVCTSSAFFHLIDLTELEPDEAADAIDWAVETLVAATLSEVGS